MQIHARANIGAIPTGGDHRDVAARDTNYEGNVVATMQIAIVLVYKVVVGIENAVMKRC